MNAAGPPRNTAGAPENAAGPSQAAPDLPAAEHIGSAVRASHLVMHCGVPASTCGCC